MMDKEIKEKVVEACFKEILRKLKLRREILRSKVNDDNGNVLTAIIKALE
jgi:hypothetical protein